MHGHTEISNQFCPVLQDHHLLHVAGNSGEGEVETEAHSVDPESLGVSGGSVGNCQYNALKAESRAPSAWGYPGLPLPEARDRHGGSSTFPANLTSLAALPLSGLCK